MNSNPTGNNPPNDEFEDLEADIDWSELQAFFLDDLKPRLGELDRLCRASDFDALSRLGHTLKGSGGGVKLPRFTDHGRTLETAAHAHDLADCVLACQALREEYLGHRPADRAALAPLFEGIDTDFKKASGF